MENTTSERQEENVFAVVKKIPVLNVIYGIPRTIALGLRGDDEGALSSVEELCRNAFPGSSILMDFGCKCYKLNNH